jgi:DNA modification methylase
MTSGMTSGCRGRWRLGRSQGEHAERVGYPAAFPEELPRRLMKLLSFPGDLVVDPFVGSGTTAIVARSLGRRFWGCDRNQTAVERAWRRLDAEQLRRAVGVVGSATLS